MTDAELAASAWTEFTKTTDSYPTWKQKGFPSTSHWAKGKSLLDQIGIAPPPPSTAINVLDYGTDDASIRAAISAAKAQSKSVFAGPASYVYSDIILLDAIKFFAAPGAVFTATNKARMAWKLVNGGAELHGAKITCPTAGEPAPMPNPARLTTPESTGVWIEKGATGFLVDAVTVDHAGSAGFFNHGGVSGVISHCLANKTLADAFHNTNGAHDCELFSNAALGCGDDMYAVISYQAQGVRCFNISIHDNVGSQQPWGRGCTVAGGHDCHILRNKIDHTYGAGVLLASESGSSTFGTDNVEVTGNIIRQPAQVIHNANIYADGEETAFPVTNVYGTGNDCDSSKQLVRTNGAVSGITVQAFAGV